MISALFLAAAVSGGWISESNFQLYVPAGYRKTEKRPLLVAIHGCTQTAGDLGGLARIAKLADEQRILVLLPNQSVAANPMHCWNWFLPENQKRGAGEPAAIKAMIDWVEARYRVDRSRVYVAGISSGGYMAAILLSCYSDVFAAGMVASAGMYEAAGDVNSGIQAALHGSDRDPKVTGRDAYQCSGAAKRLMPVLVFHGALDPYVNARSGQQAVEQFVDMNSLASNSTIRTIAEKSLDGYTRVDYGFGDTVVVRHIVVTQMGHAWSGGDPNYAYAYPNGPDQTAIMWKFFEQFRRR